MRKDDFSAPRPLGCGARPRFAFSKNEDREAFLKNVGFLSHQPLDFTVVCEDESIFIYESITRSVWAVKGSKPVIFKTGRHEKTVWYGSVSENNEQFFRQYSNGDSDCFLDYIDQLHKRFPKMILFMDKATYHKKEERVRRYLYHHRDTIKVRWFPSGFPEANPVEECWRQGKDDILGSTFYPTFNEFKKATQTFYRTKRFNVDLYKYLCY